MEGKGRKFGDARKGGSRGGESSDCREEGEKVLMRIIHSGEMLVLYKNILNKIK